MNPELQQELAAWLTKLRESANAAGNFAMEQAPLIVQERVTWGRVTETFEFFSLVIFAAIVGRLAYWLFRTVRDDEFDSPGLELCCLFASIGTVLLACFALGEFRDMAQAWFAPRLYVLEWLAGLVK